MKIIPLFIAVMLFSSLLAANLVDVKQGYSSKSGLKIVPTVRWSDNNEGIFSYCVYEGTVTLYTDLSNIQSFCKDPSVDLTVKSMHAYVNDNTNTYRLDQIQTPVGVIKDGTNYSICAQFTPSQPNAGYDFAVGCQTFTNKLGSHVEYPVINLDIEALFNGLQ